MKEIIKKLKTWWLAETPIIARFLQTLSSAIAAIPLYYSSLPEEFKTTISVDTLKYVTTGGIIVTVLLQFFNKKTKES